MAKLTLTAIKLVENANDNRIYVKAAPADNLYVAGGVALDLSPGKIADPKSLGVIGPSQVPVVNPGILSESLGGYYAAVVPTTGGLGGYKLQYFAPGGAELAAGGYPAAITGGLLLLEIPYES